MKRLLGIISAISMFCWVLHSSANAQQSVNPLVHSGLQQGNQDQAQYDAAKVRWVKDHPAEYQAESGTIQPKSGKAEEAKPYGGIENKAAWIKDNPEQYEAMQKPVSERKVLSSEELKSFPPEKQKAMRSDPAFKIID